MAIVAILIELGAGLLLLVGYKARWAALAIFVFLIPTTLIFHNFWACSAGRSADAADQLHEERHDHGRHADGVGVRRRPVRARPGYGVTNTLHENRR